MGSSNSRMGGSGRPPLSRPSHRHPQPRRPGLKRNLSSLLICGASSSSSHDLRNEMEDDPAGLLVNSAEHSDVGKFQFAAKSFALSTDCRSEYLGPRVVNSLSSEKSNFPSGNHSREDAAQNSETKETLEILYREKGLHSTAQLMDNLKSNETTSTSSHNELSPESLFADRKANVYGVNNGKGETSEIASGNYDDLKSTDDPSSDAEESCDEMSHENPENEFMIFQECDYTSGLCSGSAPSDSPFDSMVQTSSSGVGSSVADNEEDHRNGNELQIDMASVSSNILSNNFFGLTSHEARRSNRRLFWDSFSRRNFRRNANSRTFLFAADDTESLGFHDRSHLDFSGELFDYEVGGNPRSYNSSNQSTNEQRWRSSSEAWERSRNLDNGSERRATLCPSGIHPDGTCSCSSSLTAEESGARASISRIVMLAEALFEVLDEVHRQPSSLSLSMVSLPAAESVVDSLPVKNYSELERTEERDEFTQCYICLSEYNEGDTIRILPCHHEFHASCVDKWLKEIHGVCPLCRGDVREGFSKRSVSI